MERIIQLPLSKFNSLNLKIKKLSFLFFMVLMSSYAQFDTEYHMPPVWNNQHGVNNNPTRLVITTSYPSNEVTIKTSDGTTLNTTLTVTSGTPISFPLSTTLGQTTTINAAEVNKGLIITATNPIQVVHINDSKFNKTYITLKGSTALGQDFYAASQTKLLSAQYRPNDVHFMSVMATEDGTNVTIQMPGAKVFDNGTPAGLNNVTVTLNKYETYLVKTATGNNVSDNITSAHITSDKDIVVLTGGQHLRQNNGGSAADGGIDQLVPTNILGREYILSRGANTLDYAIIIATEPNTNIFADGSSTPENLTPLNPGDFYEFDLSENLGDPHFIDASSPVYVFHASGLTFNEIGMSIVPSILCRGSKTINFAEFTGLDNTATVIIENFGIPDFRFNGNSIAALGVTPKIVPGRTDWSTFSIPDEDINAVNTAFSPDAYYHLGLLVGSGNNSGTFGFLSGFEKFVASLDPITGLPIAAYQQDASCSLRGESTTFPFVLDTSCGVTSITNITTSEASSNVTFVNTGADTYDITYTTGADSNYLTDVITVEFQSTLSLNVLISGETEITMVIPPNADEDEDNIPDCDDLDDDNDGILDTDELAGVKELAGINDPFLDEDGDGILNFQDVLDEGNSGDPSTTDYTDNNNDGTPDVYDFDNDGLPNHLDLDSDGDGIPDTIEAQTTTEYITPNNDAATNGGIDSAYSTGLTPENMGLTPENTDGEGYPDYLDLDADNDGASDISEAGGEPLSGNVGTNGLDSTRELNDDFTDSNGSFDNTQADNFPNTDSEGDVDYRDLTVPTVNELNTKDITPTLTGTHDSDALLTVTVDAISYTEGDANLTDNGDDTWTLDIPTDIAVGTYEVIASSELGPLTKVDTSNNELIIETPDIDCDTLDRALLFISGCIDGITIDNDLVSPNYNDGIFKINNIDLFPNNTVKIYNRWGVIVFDTFGYDNNANAFRGISDGRTTIKKNENLPVGIYFYTIEYFNAEEKMTLNGYLYINQ